MTPLLSVTDLGLSIGSHDILRGVSFTVGAGEAVGIVGESGSGKSMTLKAILGMAPAGARVTGSIRLGEGEVTTFSASGLRALRRDQVGMVFQDPHQALNPVRRVGDFLTESARRRPRAERRVRWEQATALLADVGIRDAAGVMSRYPHELSGGMLQRVVIAAALVRAPRLLLADEPTTALDVTTQSDVLALLDERRRAKGASLLLISHDIELVAAVCDRIVVLHRGRIVETLTAAQIHEGRMTEDYTAALLACRPRIDVRVPRLPVLDQDQWGE